MRGGRAERGNDRQGVAEEQWPAMVSERERTYEGMRVKDRERESSSTFKTIFT